jgi:hypothetical protein
VREPARPAWRIGLSARGIDGTFTDGPAQPVHEQRVNLGVELALVIRF